MKKVITGTIVSLVDNPGNKIIIVETEPGKPAVDKKPAVQPKRLQVATNEHSLLDGLQRGKTVKIIIEQ